MFKTKVKRNIFLTLVLLLIAGGLIWTVRHPGDGGFNIITTGDEKKSESLLPLGEGQTVADISKSEKQFKHSILGFSFSYDSGYNISSFGNYFDSNGETILLQKLGTGLQVLITPFDENIELTATRIKKDLPSLHLLNPEEKSIGNGDRKIKIVIFSSDNNLSTGKSIEGWFVNNKSLYQISADASEQDLFDTLIKSWKLEQ